MTGDEREQRYAEAICLALGFTQPLRPHQIAARAAIEVANVEQQACASDNDRLIAEVEQLRSEVDRLGAAVDGEAWADEQLADERRRHTETAQERDGWKHRAETAEAKLAKVEAEIRLRGLGTTGSFIRGVIEDAS